MAALGEAAQVQPASPVVAGRDVGRTGMVPIPNYAPSPAAPAFANSIDEAVEIDIW